MRLTVSALAISLALPLTAQADDGFSVDTPEAFGNAVRAYLMENPEVLIEAIGVLEAREAEARMGADEQLVTANADAILAGDDWQGGNPDGDVTIVEFIDYRCGYCKRAQPEVNALLETDGNIRLIRKELPILGEQSVLAARFALATRIVAGDEAYGNVSEALMAMRSDITEETLSQLATTYGLDAGAILTEMNSAAVTERLQATQQLAMRLQIQGTPAFVVGSTLLRGYLPLDQMEQVVAQARAAE